MKKIDIIQHILGERCNNIPQLHPVTAFAPSNIALCKYWGKRDRELNLPMTSSLSISLGDHGTHTTLSISHDANDSIVLNGEVIDLSTAFARRVIDFLNLFRIDNKIFFHMDTHSTIPIAAGLASSASGFASLTLALNELFQWHLTKRDMSILARFGSGSASRSLWSGFVEWQRGERDDGMDSVGRPLDAVWKDLGIGLLIVSDKQKSVSSREAMARTIDTSVFYNLWPQKVAHDLEHIKQAIAEYDFDLLGKTAESNALAMHATMLTAWPPISYYLPDTIQMMQTIWQLRADGLPIYFTQDAGSNLKLLFLRSDLSAIKSVFTPLKIIFPFD